MLRRKSEASSTSKLEGKSLSGLTTYNAGNRVLSAAVGYSLRQAKAQGYLTNQQVADATTAEDLVANVQAAVVTAGAEANAQRINIINAIRRGASLGDLSDTRIQAATTVEELAQDTWVSEDPNTTHLGVGIYG